MATKPQPQKHASYFTGPRRIVSTSSGVIAQRRLTAVEYLKRKKGPATCGELARACGIPSGSVAATFNHPWFVRTRSQIALAVGAAAPNSMIVRPLKTGAFGPVAIEVCSDAVAVELSLASPLTQADLARLTKYALPLIKIVLQSRRFAQTSDGYQLAPITKPSF